MRGALADYSGKTALAILAISLLSAIFLAWSATLSLRGVFEPTPKDVSRFTINVSGSRPSTPEDTHAGVSVVRLVVDGRRARPGDLILSGSWEPGWDSADRPKDPEGSDPTAWPRRAGWAARLNPSDTAEPASVSFSGTSAAVLFNRGNPCEHLSISTDAGKIWGDDCSHLPADPIVAVDLPTPVMASHWPFAFWLVVSFVMVAAVRPGLDRRRTEFWLTAYLSALHLLVWSAQCVGLIYDSLNQLPTLKFNVQGWPAYFPPGYPLLVGIGYLVSAVNVGSVITLIQHVMMIATIVWCFRLLRRCVAQPLAYLTTLAMGAAAPTLFLPQAIMSENAALFGMAGALYFAVCYRDSHVRRHGIISGLLLGWAGLARIVPLAAAGPAILLVMLGAEPLINGVKRFGLILAIAIGTVALPTIWFGLRSGSFALANSLGRHLYNRVVTDQFLLDKSAPATARFLRLIEPVNPEGKAHWEIAALLKKQGLDYEETEALMRRVSWEGICESPWQFIVFSLQQSWTQFFHNPVPLVPWWSVPDKYTAELESVPILGVHAGSLLWRERLEQQFAATWTFLPWLAIAGLASIPFLRQRMILLSFAIIPSGYIVSSAFVEFEYGRYTVAIIPFIYCLVAEPFAAAISKRTSKHSELILLPDQNEGADQSTAQSTI